MTSEMSEHRSHPAPATFSKNGFAYRLLQETGKFALYEARTLAGTGIRSFEVHIVRSMPERAIGNAIIPAGPRLASNEEFGTWAWSYTSKEAAQRKMNDLVSLGGSGK